MRRTLSLVVIALCAVLFCARAIHLGADFTWEKEFSRDGVLYTDEGWYANNAIAWHREESWHRPGELNFAVNLPVLQVLHALSFSILGVRIEAARATILLSVGLLLVTLGLVVWRRIGPVASALTVAWLTANYFLFQYSRFAIAEAPMVLVALWAFLVAEKGCREGSVPLRVLAGALLGLSFYTKTSALFAFPLVALASPLAHGWNSRRIVADGLWVVAGLAPVVALHTFLLAIPYATDYHYFHRLNLGINTQTNPIEVVSYAAWLVGRMELIDQVLFLPFFGAVGLLLFVDRTFRERPLVLLTLAWLAIYLLLFSVYANPRPRYWVGMLPPLGLLVGTAAVHLWRLRERWPRGATVATAVFGVFLIVSLGRGFREQIQFLREPKDSFGEFARSVKATLDADPLSGGILLGHFATTMALHAEIEPVNDRYAPSDLAERIARWRPRYLVVEESIETRDFGDEGTTLDPRADTGFRRLPVLQQHYERIELLRTFDVFGNYRGWPVSFYRLHPRPELGWEASIPSGTTEPVPSP
jgi:hypothetical protein